ncbi:MAG: hypothetical protein AAGC71_11755, partial [Pseudomonadota bacterium]
ADRSFTGEAVLATAAALQGDIEPAWRILDDMEVAAEHGAIDVKDWLNATAVLSASYAIEASSPGMEWRKKLGTVIGIAYFQEFNASSMPTAESADVAPDPTTQR